MTFASRCPGLRRRFLPVFAGVLALTCIATVRPVYAGSTGPQLSVALPTHDFGTVSQGTTLVHQFKIGNTGAEVLQISEVKPACGCTTTGEWPHTLAPGASGLIPVQLDTTHFIGPVTKTISIFSDDPAHPEFVLELKANIWTPISVLKPVLVLPAVSDPMRPGTAATTIRNETSTPVTVSILRNENPVFVPELRTIVPGKEFELVTSAKPPLPEGTQTGRIVLKTSNPQRPEITIDAVVTVLPAIQVAPAQITFPASRLSAPEKRFAVLLNHRNVDLDVSDVKTDAPGVTLSTSRSEDGRQITITLNFPAGFAIGAGEKWFLRGRTNQPQLPAFAIPILYVGRD
jgi:hypothetical protein